MIPKKGLSHRVGNNRRGIKRTKRQMRKEYGEYVPLPKNSKTKTAMVIGGFFALGILILRILYVVVN